MSRFNYKDIIEGQLPQDLYKNKDLESQAIGNTLNKLQSNIDKLERDVNPLTAINKGLEQWEGFFKLPSNNTNTLETRRAKVVSELIQFMSDENIIRKDEMESIVSLFVDEVKVVEHFSEYLFHVVFVKYNLHALNLQEMVNVIDKIKPSWLSYVLEVEFRTILTLQTSYKKYDINYPMCGTYLCGTHPTTATDGLVLKGGEITLETKYVDDVNYYPMTSENTFNKEG